MAKVPAAGAAVSETLAQLERMLGCGGGSGGLPAAVCSLLATLPGQVASIPSVGMTLDAAVTRVGSLVGCQSAAAVPAASGASSGDPAVEPPAVVTQAANFTG